MKREELMDYLDELLQPEQFRDYCPNGLQVEGCDEVRRIVGGVTASQALLERARELRADAVFVHHGYFWKGEDGRITGMRRKRIATLIDNDINLIAYHLPLDAHAELGNNAQLALHLGWRPEGRFGEQQIGWYGCVESEKTPEALENDLLRVLGRKPLLVGGRRAPIRRLAWCSGGAQSYFEQAIALGVDAYISGEISEQTVHLAEESGIAYFAAGHHATERFGVQSVLAHLAQRFSLDCQFIDLHNPV